MQISSSGCSEATGQQISYPPSLILWFIFLMLLPPLHVSSPESLCSRLCTSCALPAWQEKSLGDQSLWEDGAGGMGHWLCQEQGERPCHGMFMFHDCRAMEKHRLPAQVFGRCLQLVLTVETLRFWGCESPLDVKVLRTARRPFVARTKLEISMQGPLVTETTEEGEAHLVPECFYPKLLICTQLLQLRLWRSLCSGKGSGCPCESPWV